MPKTVILLLSDVRIKYFLFALGISCLAILVVYASHLSSYLTSKLHALEQTHESLNIQHSQLLLEYTSITSPYRVEYIARTTLNMRPPQASETITLKNGKFKR